MAQLVVDTNSWISVAEANEYMDSRFGSWEFWDDETNKQAALITAYKRIKDTGVFSNLPDVATQNMKDAQCEMALFLAAEGGDILRRGALQAQGVMEAGVAKEKFDKSARRTIAFPPEVLKLLEEYAGDVDTNLFYDDLERDDDEDVL